jgi:hypothetical protein
MSYRDLVKKFGVAHTTIMRWKAKHDPDNWEEYQNAVVREMMDASIVKVKKQFAGSVAGQLEDAISLRTINRKLILEYSKRLVDGKIKPTEGAVKTLRLLASTSGAIQQQMAHVFGLPTHRVATDSRGAPLSAFIDDDVDVDNLTEKELVGLIAEMNIVDGDEEA